VVFNIGCMVSYSEIKPSIRQRQKRLVLLGRGMNIEYETTGNKYLQRNHGILSYIHGIKTNNLGHPNTQILH
jgi:hypothetical protein